MYYMSVAGFIPDEKKNEFEHTCHLTGTQIPKTCAGFSFRKDQYNQDTYRFISYWSSLEALEDFKASTPFHMLIGAISTLGELIERKQIHFI
ncbi:MAG: hypothetical protein C5B52_05285 [Bacteroidetes bacterium]|nr:MAG: hypothetical protein C5B52_05285 [Bacteroidota bacterium]